MKLIIVKNSRRSFVVDLFIWNEFVSLQTKTMNKVLEFTETKWVQIIWSVLLSAVIVSHGRLSRSQVFFRKHNTKDSTVTYIDFTGVARKGKGFIVNIYIY